tara:strand:+ start:929 stop:1279 length:351 start_codon:yes stop_codon:yes gene_type:complete
MENHASGSVIMVTGSFDLPSDFDLDIEMLLQNKQFEQDLIDNFTKKMYTIKNDAPKPLWSYCSVKMQLVRVWPQSEVFVLDEELFSSCDESDSIDCLIGQNLFKIPKKYIATGDWN